MNIDNFEIIVGTYEEYLLGYNFIAKDSQLVQSFAAHDHSSSIRSTAVGSYYLASGAADDRIIIYDLKVRKEHCMLTHHESTVNCLQFTKDQSHIVSGSADGVLAIARVGNWQLEKQWNKAHNGSAILDIAIHSSGKLALTLGADCSLRTWNLVKGRQAYIINLNSKCRDAKSLDKIIWAEDSVRFILYGGKYTEIWSINTGGILKVIEHDDKVTSCIWLSNKRIVVGYEDGQIALIGINKLSKRNIKAHDGRVKALAKYDNWLISASSTGEIKVWNKELEESSKVNTGCRITCLGVASITKIKKETESDLIEDVEYIQRNPIKKSSIVVEIEDSDMESIVDNGKNKQITKNSETRIPLRAQITKNTEKYIPKSKKRKLIQDEFDMRDKNKLLDMVANENVKGRLRKKKKMKRIVTHEAKRHFKGS